MRRWKARRQQKLDRSIAEARVKCEAWLDRRGIAPEHRGWGTAERHWTAEEWEAAS